MSYMKWRGRFRQQGCPLPGTYLEFGYFLSDEEVDLVSVIPRVIKTAPRLFPIPASTARFLVVASHGLGNIPMGNKSVEYKRIRYMMGVLSAPEEGSCQEKHLLPGARYRGTNTQETDPRIYQSQQGKTPVAPQTGLSAIEQPN